MLRDLRLALRQIRRQPLFHFAVAVTLALGIGANTAIFSVVRAVLLQPLPFPEPDELVRVWNRNDERGFEQVAAALQDVRDWRVGAPSAAAFAVYDPREGNLATDAGAERVDYAIVSHDFFEALGILPARGRAFEPEEDRPGADGVVVVSHAFWQNRLGGDPAALGSTVRLDGAPLTVIGIMPAGFAFPLRGTALWKPIGLGPDDAGPRGGRWVQVVARVRAGSSPAALSAELSAIADANAAAFPDTNRGWSTWVQPLRAVVVGDVRATLLFVSATVALVLLIACANVTSLLLARAHARALELAVRTALGAGRPRIVRQMLVEAGTIAAVGGLLGVLLARPAVGLVARLGETPLAGAGMPRLDAVTLLFAFAASMLAALLIGLLPAVRAGRASTTPVLRSGRGSPGRGGRARSALIAAEIALATTVLVCAGLLARSLAAYARVDVGVATENRLTMRLAPGWTDVRERERAVVLWDRLQTEIAAVPGVEAVGAVNRTVLDGHWWTGSLVLRGQETRAGPAPSVLNRVVTPGFLEAAGVPLLRGRLLDARDDAAGRRVMVVSETAARLLRGDADPIGALVTNEDPANPAAPWFTVVGVVGDVRYGGLADPMPAASYTTLAQARWGHFGDWGMTLTIATRGEPTSVIAALRAAIARVDADLPAYEVRTVEGRIADALSAQRHVARLVGVLALLSLVLAAVGTYAVLAFTVSRQVREIGLRIAVGASAAAIVALVVHRGMRPALIGVAAGLAGAAALAPLLQGLLFGVRPVDALTYLAIAGLLLAVAAAACVLPALRASRLSPLEALARD